MNITLWMAAYSPKEDAEVREMTRRLAEGEIRLMEAPGEWFEGAAIKPSCYLVQNVDGNHYVVSREIDDSKRADLVGSYETFVSNCFTGDSNKSKSKIYI